MSASTTSTASTGSGSACRRASRVPAATAWPKSSSLIALDLEGGGRVLVRPSGTEPKLKIYVDLRVPLAASERVSAKEEEALRAAQALADDVADRVGLG